MLNSSLLTTMPLVLQTLVPSLSLMVGSIFKTISLLVMNPLVLVVVDTAPTFKGHSKILLVTTLGLDPSHLQEIPKYIPSVDLLNSLIPTPSMEITNNSNYTEIVVP